MICVSSYRFIQLDKLAELKTKLKNKALSLNLKGTILISSEGVNLFLSGDKENIHEFNKFLGVKTPIGELVLKESPAKQHAFNRMLVRIKKEIISMGVPEIQPGKYTSPSLPAKEFKKWLDEKRDFVILDTRNDYELRLGKFNNSIDLNIQTFRQFPEALKQIENLKDKTIVSLCTGGIRCEKAAPLLEQSGFKNVYQLEGGILKYFEECGDAHYTGECFVFDQRVGVNGNLEETPTKQCFVCRSPLSPEEQLSEKYIVTKCCPYCYEKNGSEFKNTNNSNKETHTHEHI